MKLNIYKANNQTDIMQEQLQYIKKNIEAGRRQYIIVPDKYSLSMEREIMQAIDLQASLSFEVLTFARFANLMADMQNVHILSSLGATMIIQMILNKHQKDLLCFQKTRKGINLASVIFDSIAQLRACNVSAQNIKDALPNIQNKLLQSKLSDIALIMKEYEDYLGTKYIDSANRMQLLGRAIENSTDIQDVDVHFCHFDSLTPKGEDILALLVSKANSVSCGIVAPDKKQNNSFLYDKTMYDDILQIAKQKNITPNIIDAKSTLKSVQKHITNNLMASNFEVLDEKQPTVTAWVAKNINAEVRKVAMDIAYKIKNGSRFNEIVVNCASLQNYAPVIRKIFDDYQIPHWIDLGYALTDSQLIKFLDATFELITSHYAREDILIYLKNSLCGLTIEEQMLCERVVNKYGIQYDMLFGKLNVNDEDYDAFVKIRDKVFAPFKQYQKDMQTCTTVGEHVVTLQKYLQDMQLEQKLEYMALNNRQNKDLYNESINRQVFGRLMQCLDNMYDIMAEYAVDFDDFCCILHSGIDTVNLSPLPMAIDCVYVGQNLQSVFSTVPHLYVLGASEGDFPAVVSDVGIISDMDIGLLKNNRINLVPTITSVNMQSQFSTIQNLALFDKELHISYVLQSSDGQHTPSAVLESLINILSYNNKKLPVIDVQTFLTSNLAFSNEQERLLYTWGNLHNALGDVIIESNNEKRHITTNLLATAIKVLKEHGYGEVFDNIQTYNTVYSLNESIDINMFEQKSHLSVTELERYFLCPYLHFVDYALKLQKNETSDIASLDNGNIIHAVLEKYIIYYNKHSDIKNNQIGGVVQSIFDEVIAGPDFARFSQNAKNSFALKKLRQECVNTAKAVSYQLSHSAYKVKFVEKSFGTKDFVPTPEIVVFNKTIKIRGKVDRLDEWKGKYRIVDYKTSKNAGKFSILDLYLGKKIQLFYYMYAILEGLKKQGKDACAGGVYYLPIHREYTDKLDAGIYDGYRMEGLTIAEMSNIMATDNTLSEQSRTSRVVDISLNKGFDQGKIASRGDKLCTDLQLNKILSYCNKIVNTAICEIASGYIAPKPLTDACKYCEYHSICKIACESIKKERTTKFDVNIKCFEDIE
ncbi:MAG: exodeoxyribonuclease V subunit gamma [Clostridia bacterium]|nr:exodeoxyribonuclease V subunit gamma [Clostridia bacterium]